MEILNSPTFTLAWVPLKCLLWASLYLVFGIFVPFFMTRAWTHQHGANVQHHPKQLFQRGELGLAGLWLAISALWNLQTSQFLPHTVAVGSILLAFSGIMAGAVWIESYCRQSTGIVLNTNRVWRDSRNMFFLVMSMAAVTEILLDRYSKVVAR
jgi:hypothetical protein